MLTKKTCFTTLRLSFIISKLLELQGKGATGQEIALRRKSVGMGEVEGKKGGGGKGGGGREGRGGRRGGGRGKMVVQMGGNFFGVFFLGGGGQNVNKGRYGDLGGGQREHV